MKKLGTLRRDGWTMNDPFCYLCGMHMAGWETRYERDAGASGIFTEKEEWADEVKKYGCVQGKPGDLAQVYFEIPWIWPRLYRTIFQHQSRHKTEFHLSGVALFNKWSREVLIAPSDPNEMILGNPEPCRDRFFEAYVKSSRMSERQKYRNPFAYPMHERCWSLMTLILDVDLIQQNLDLFVEVLLIRSNEKIYNSYKIFCEERYWMGWLDSIDYLPKRDRKPYTEWQRKGLECSDYGYAHRDPFRIAELRDLARDPETFQRKHVKKSQMTARKKRKDQRKEMATRQKPKTHSMVLRSKFEPESAIVPTEIILTIADFLPDSADLRMLLWVFPSWAESIPPGYWRARFIRDSMLEREDLSNDDGLKWKYIYFNMDRLLAKSHGWRNRRRIMKILEGTKALFLKHLASYTI